MAAAVATEEPEIAANSAQPAILVCSRPPGMTQTSLREPAIDAEAEARVLHDLGHQDEQRDRRQGEAVHRAPAHQADAAQRRHAAMHQQVDDGRHADGEGNGHPRGQQAEEDHQDEEDFEAGAHETSFRTSSTTALPSTISSMTAPTTMAVSGIHSGVPSAVLAIASRR